MCPTDSDMADKVVWCFTCPFVVPIFLPYFILCLIFECIITILCCNADEDMEEDDIICLDDTGIEIIAKENSVIKL